MSEQDNTPAQTKQRVTRKSFVSDEELKKRVKAQKIMGIISKPNVWKFITTMMSGVNAIKAPFRKTKAPDNTLSRYLYFKFARWFYYYAQKPQRDDLVIPPIPEPDKATISMIKDMTGELGLTTFSLDTNMYHAKVINNEDAKKILTIQEEIEVAPSEKVMPYKVARKLLLEPQDTYAAAPCLCRNATKDTCVPKERLSCIYVGKENVDFVLKHSSWAKPITQEKALEILEEAKNDGLVHTIFWNRWVGEGPFCICNCCSCHCGGIGAWVMSAGMVPMFSETGFVAQVDETLCTGCGRCVPSCHFEAIRMDSVRKKAVVDETKCVGCEVCLGMCNFGAKSMKGGPSGAKPLFGEVEQIKAAG